MTAPVQVPPPPVMPALLARVPARLRRLRGVEADAIVVEAGDGAAMVLRAGGAS